MLQIGNRISQSSYSYLVSNGGGISSSVGGGIGNSTCNSASE